MMTSFFGSMCLRNAAATSPAVSAWIAFSCCAAWANVRPDSRFATI
jgi:hypothetical protein